MNDSSLIRIHRLQYHCFSCFLYFISDASCKVFKSLFTAFTIVLCIKFYTDVIGLSFVYHKTCQVLKRVKSLSSFSNEDTHILSFEIYFKTSICGIILRCDLHLAQIHGSEYIMKEYPCSFFYFFDLGRICNDLDRFACLYRLFSCLFRLSRLFFSGWSFFGRFQLSGFFLLW